jgi:hypothetical protein
MTSTTFTNGDLVRRSAPAMWGRHGRFGNMGDLCVVTESRPSAIDVQRVSDGKLLTGCDPSAFTLEHRNEPPKFEPKFKAGDKVEIRKCGSLNCGAFATVTSPARSADDIVRVKLEDGQYRSYTESNLRAAPSVSQAFVKAFAKDVVHAYAEAPKPIVKEPARIEVVDRTNHGRVLGSIEKPTSWVGRTRQFAVMPAMQVADYYAPSSFLKPAVMRYEKVEMELVYVYRNGGLDVEVKLGTDASLKVLMTMPDFRLPGEPRESAKRRRYLQAYSG